MTCTLPRACESCYNAIPVHIDARVHRAALLATLAPAIDNVLDDASIASMQLCNLSLTGSYACGCFI